MNTILQSLILSASLGALIGLIRQWAEQQNPDQENKDYNDVQYAGLRTFILWSLLGYTGAFVSDQHNNLVFISVLIIVGAHLLFQGSITNHTKSIGLTTGAASLLTLLIGSLVYWEQVAFAVMLTALSMIVLGIKNLSHTWTKKFTSSDIRSTLQFVAVTGVILPIVPNQGYGPYNAINPYSLWWMVVLISGLGFLGYILIRCLGTKAGIPLTGIVGGLASSTATTLAFSKQSKVHPNLSPNFAVAIVLACTIMLFRVLLILFFIYPPILNDIWLPFLIIATPGVLYILLVFLIQKKNESEINLQQFKNPLGLSIAIKFALLYGIISLMVKVFSQMELSEGLLALSFISGLTDMDAIALSMVNNLKDGTVLLDACVKAIIVAAIANTLLKGFLVFNLGSTKLRLQITIAFGSTIIAGIAAFFMV